MKIAVTVHKSSLEGKNCGKENLEMYNILKIDKFKE
jgi:hypothetical protein